MACLETQVPFNSRDIFPAFYMSSLTSWKCCQERSLAPTLTRTHANTGASLSELNLVLLSQFHRNDLRFDRINEEWEERSTLVTSLTPRPVHTAPPHPLLFGPPFHQGCYVCSPPPSLATPFFMSIFACFFELHVFRTIRTLCFCSLVTLCFVVCFLSSSFSFPLSVGLLLLKFLTFDFSFLLIVYKSTLLCTLVS